MIGGGRPKVMVSIWHLGSGGPNEVAHMSLSKGIILKSGIYIY